MVYALVELMNSDEKMIVLCLLVPSYGRRPERKNWRSRLNDQNLIYVDLKSFPGPELVVGSTVAKAVPTQLFGNFRNR